MTITWVQFAWAVTILLGWAGSLIGVIWFLTRQLVAQFKSSIDESTGGLKVQIDVAQADYKRLDNEFKSFLANLPIQYYRREDAIREFTALTRKIDQLHELLSKVMTSHV